MTEHANHTGPDPDLLERYVLNRVTEAERAYVTSMVQASAAWRAALDDELYLAAGIRRAARLNLKARIASRTTAIPTHATPWPRVLAAAAALVILVSMGVYYDWFSRRSAPPGEQLTEPPAVLSDQTAPSPDVAASQGPPSGGSLKERDQASSARSSEQAGKAQPPASTQKAKDMNAGKFERRASPGDGSRTYWAEGYLLAGAEAKGTAAAAEGRAQPTEETNLMQKSAATSRPDKGVAPATALSGPKAMRFAVSLQPTTAFDESRIPGQRKQGSGTVPVLLQQRNDSLLITLYTDTPADGAARREATVRSITSDSLLVQCGRYVIGLRLPPPLQTSEENPPPR